MRAKREIVYLKSKSSETLIFKPSASFSAARYVILVNQSYYYNTTILWIKSESFAAGTNLVI